MQGEDGAGPLTAVALVIDGAYRWRQKRKENWKYYSPLEQVLRRLTQGVTVCCMTIAAPFLMCGWREVVEFFPWAFWHPDQAWPATALFGIPLMLGFFRMRDGWRYSLGVPEVGMCRGANMRILFGGPPAVFIAWQTHLGRFEGAIWLAGLLLALASWWALTGLLRAAALRSGERRMQRLMEAEIARTERQWRNRK